MIQYDRETIGYISVYERQTGAKIKDAFYEDKTLVFVVQQGEMARALGKQGVHVKRFGLKIKKTVKLLEFNSDVRKFVLKLLYPLRPEVEMREDKLVLIAKDVREKGQIFGRDKSNLKRVQKVVRKYFPIEVVVA